MGISDALREFAAEVTAKSGSAVAGEPEDQLRGPFETLLRDVGTTLGKAVVCVGETRLSERQGKPDYGVTESGLLTGYAELKAPGKGVERRRFVGHDRDQFDRFSQLPNILYTDGNEWAVYHYGNKAGRVVRLGGDVSQYGESAIRQQDAAKLLPLITRFLEWEPVIPLNSQEDVDLKEFAKQLAPLCKFLRDDVIEALSDKNSQLNLVAAGWRDLLFPNASNEQFADAYAQTVTFALLLARSQGAGNGDGNRLTFENAQAALQAKHNLLSAALEALTRNQVKSELNAGLDALLRLIGAIPSSEFAGTVDPWLYFYEDFLAEYDSNLRKDAGVYYTPVEIVRAQVRLIDSLLVNRLGKTQGFADESVITIDPATGTGTYLLGIIEHSIIKIAEKYGQGASPSYAEQLGRNLYGFELMVGPYAVTELRVTNALHDHGGTSSEGAQVYLTNTLESPNSQPMQGYFEPALSLSKQHEQALRVKKEVPVLVCVGNPPYDRAAAAAASGGWVRYGDEGVDDKPILEDFLKPARDAGHGGDLHNVYNLYVYFWRWALWKVFEQNGADGPGIVSFISASSYLDGDAFAGMREHLRRVCDEVWILDMGGEQRGPRKSENIFNIQTPVAIAVAFRTSEKTPDTPAKVRYARIEGTRAEKLASLDAITDFGQVNWQDCLDVCQAAFRPGGEGAYFDWPMLTNLMPWQQSGVKAGRTWVIAPLQEMLNQRWQTLVQNDRGNRRVLFKDSPTGRKVHESPGQLPAISDLERDNPPPDSTRLSYRTLDRQFVLNDARLLDRPSPTLWFTRSDKQIYLSSLFSQPHSFGPALTASSIIPDLDNFRGSYGAKSVMPLYRDADAVEPNILSGLVEKLGSAYGREVTPDDFAAYLYGILAHPGYTECYYAELDTREVRVPFTKDAALFEKVRDAGARLLWLHTYGQRFVPSGQTPGQVPQGAARNTVGVPLTEEGYPESFRYDAAGTTLHVGEGQFAPVDPEVYEFQVSGLKVVQSWLRYRMKKGAGKKSSPLDDIRPNAWPTAFTRELLELLWVLEATVAGYPEQAELLSAVTSGECFTAKEMPDEVPGMRQPPKPPAAGERLV